MRAERKLFFLLAWSSIDQLLKALPLRVGALRILQVFSVCDEDLTLIPFRGQMLAKFLIHEDCIQMVLADQFLQLRRRTRHIQQVDGRPRVGLGGQDHWDDARVAGHHAHTTFFANTLRLKYTCQSLRVIAKPAVGDLTHVIDNCRAVWLRIGRVPDLTTASEAILRDATPQHDLPPQTRALHHHAGAQHSPDSGRDCRDVQC